MSERLLTAREVAELLGFAAGTIVDWAERDEIPSFKVGGRLRFRESEVSDWLEARRVGKRSLVAREDHVDRGPNAAGRSDDRRRPWYNLTWLLGHLRP